MSSDPLLDLEQELLQAAHRQVFASRVRGPVHPGSAIKIPAEALAPVVAARTPQRLTGRAATGALSGRRVLGSRQVAALIVVAISCVIAATAAVGAVTGLWNGLPLGLLTTSAPPSPSLRSILGVLRRPQTAADRDSRVITAFHVGPGLGRAVVELGGVRRATRLANGVEVFLVPEQLSQFTKDQYNLHGDVLGVLLGIDGQPSGGACCLDGAHIRAIGRGGLTGEIPRGSTTIVLVLPDGIARVRLLFGRQTRPGGHAYGVPLTLDIPVHGNVAAATTTARGVGDLQPLRVTWYAADGRTVKAYTNPFLPPNPDTVLPRPQPAPPTELSRLAETNPATPNPVTIQPANGHRYLAHGRDHSEYDFSFAIILKRSGYAWTLTGPSGPTCHSPTAYQREPTPGPLVRGQTFTAPEIPPPAGWCPGTYRLAVAAIGPDGRQHPPFGHATFHVSR
jgi:hypothetical protein